jgi:hypothetical protein
MLLLWNSKYVCISNNNTTVKLDHGYEDLTVTTNKFHGPIEIVLTEFDCIYCLVHEFIYNLKIYKKHNW